MARKTPKVYKLQTQGGVRPMTTKKPNQVIDETETDDFADTMIDSVCPDVINEVTPKGGLLFNWTRKSTVVLSPRARQAFQRADRLEIENARLKDEIAKLRAGRADKGKRHRKRPKRSSEWGKKAKEVAEDFNKAKQALEPGVPEVGSCTEAKIKQWDIKYPDADHANKWGYHAELRLLAKFKTEYNRVLQFWSCYWSDYKRQFLKWRRIHPASPRSSFRFEQLVRINGFNPDWIGQDDKGVFYNLPKRRRG